MTIVHLNRAVLGILTASSLFCLHAAREAFTLDILAGDLQDPPRSEVTEVEPIFVMSADYLTLATDNAPFSPSRQPSDTRFGTSGENAEDEPAIDSQPLFTEPNPASLRLFGTLLFADDGGVALVQRMGDAPRLVRPGDVVGEWTLERLYRGVAIFSTASGTDIEIRIQNPGA
jgi:hypothetical protein